MYNDDIYIHFAAVYNQQTRTPGSVGCPKLRNNTVVLVPVDIKTNITVAAQDLPDPSLKVL